MATEISKQSKFSKWFNRFFGLTEEKKPLVTTKARTKLWQQGGGKGFGKPAWMRSDRVIADWNKPKAGKREQVAA